MTRELLVDGHVHFHRCFRWADFLDAAARNFSRARENRHDGADCPGCLLFTESAGAEAFQSLMSRCPAGPADGWQPQRTDEPDSILLRHADGDLIIVVSGRQIVTAERLEVLSIGTATTIPDGQPIHAVLRSVMRDDAVAVLPWGAGKWWGRRGRVITELIEARRDLHFHLGDNGGRTRWLPGPSLFQTADERGIPVLGGSDPLPLPGQVTRAGSYGFVLDDWRETSRPSNVIKERLRALTESPASFGTLSSPWEMLRSQMGLRWRRRGRAADATA
jgi:hypothetical protein